MSLPTGKRIVSCESTGKPVQPMMRSWSCGREREGRRGGQRPARGERVEGREREREQKTHEGEDHDGVGDGAEARDLEGLEREGLLALHLVEELEALETGRLLEVGRDLARLAALTCVRTIGVRVSEVRLEGGVGGEAGRGAKGGRRGEGEREKERAHPG